MDRALLIVTALSAAYLLDWLIGDPRYLPHPVRLLGRLILLLEKTARSLFKAPGSLKAAGAIIVVVAAGGSAVLTICLLAAAYRTGPAAGLILETYLLFTVLAGGDLWRHVRAVEQSLSRGNLGEARSAAAMLVSRETGKLNENGLSRAALESLFENSADGFVAPLFYAALGGAPAAVFYKAVNTLDSMLGYKTRQYINLGYFAAKTDDILSYIPSRLTALLFITAGFTAGSRRRAWQVLREDCRKHESPNSAWPEAAAAGVLGLKLGGGDIYRGQKIERPLINASGKEPVSGDILRGLALFRIVSLFAFAALLLLSYWLRIWGALLF